MPDDLIPPAPAAPPAPPAAPPAAPAPPAALPAEPPARSRRADDDVGTPEERATISNIRQRERKRAMKDLYGTDDEEEIERIKRRRAEADSAFEKNQQELERLRQKDAEAERAKMSETERLSADITALREENKQLKDQVAKAREEALTERQNSAVKQAAIRHRIRAKPAVLRVVLAEFAAHYLSLTNTERRRFASQPEAERMLERWMGRFAKENPEMCEAAPAAAADKPEERPAAIAQPRPAVRRPVGTQRPAAPPAARSATTARSPDMDENGKTTLPGRPNSMTRAEVDAFKRKNNIGRRAG